MIDIRSALVDRAEGVASRNPDLVVRYSIYTDDVSEWGILSILNEDERVVGLEFIETDDSWKRPGAVKDYTNAAAEGYPVAVVVPDESFMAFRRSAIERGGTGFSTYLFSDLGLRTMIRA
ncbi:MAG: hypothetical protein ISF22_07135 [Methanomassiliicoccus sp.]|nr:hypothetical protein [Methanomassiliicoccus sp.]